jgi:ribonucleoside-diphosphate reductase alpha chain
MSARQKLPWRRESETCELEHEGARFTATISRFEDGRLAELFLRGGKAGSAVETAAHDGAIAVSLALQHGCDLETIRHALTRLQDDRAAGPIGAALDLFAEAAA